MSDRAFKKLDSLIMAITENACGNGSAEDVAEKREALESHIHGMQSRLDSLEKDAAHALEALQIAAQEIRKHNKASPALLLINAQILSAALQSQGATK